MIGMCNTRDPFAHKAREVFRPQCGSVFHSPFKTVPKRPDSSRVSSATSTTSVPIIYRKIEKNQIQSVVQEKSSQKSGLIGIGKRKFHIVEARRTTRCKAFKKGQLRKKHPDIGAKLEHSESLSESHQPFGRREAALSAIARRVGRVDVERSCRHRRKGLFRPPGRRSRTRTLSHRCVAKTGNIRLHGPGLAPSATVVGAKRNVRSPGMLLTPHSKEPFGQTPWHSP